MAVTGENYRARNAFYCIGHRNVTRLYRRSISCSPLLSKSLRRGGSTRQPPRDDIQKKKPVGVAKVGVHRSLMLARDQLTLHKSRVGKWLSNRRSSPRRSWSTR